MTGQMERRRWQAASVVAVIVTMAFLLPLAAAAQGVDIGGGVKGRYVHDLQSGEPYALLSTLNLDLETDIGPMDIYLNPQVSWDLERGEAEIVLDEGYVDLYFATFDLRAGKQKVTWGKADGLVVTNLINPLDFTQYPAVEFEDKFRAVEALKVNYYLGNDVVELAWMPKFEPAQMDTQLLEQQIAQQLPNPVLNLAEKEIGFSLANSELAVKYSSLGSRYDYELVAGYLWDDQPTAHVRFAGDQQVVTPRHHRFLLAGGSLSTTVGPIVVRGEGAYLQGKVFGTSDFARHPDGTVKKNQAHLLLAGDYPVGRSLLSLQVLESVILSHEAGMKDERFAETATFLISRRFLRDTLTTELMFLYDSAQDYLTAQPRITYDYSDNVNFKFGADYALTGGRQSDVVFAQMDYLF